MPVGPDDPKYDSGFSRTASRAETLLYLIEIIEELKEMAEQSGYRTLAAVLAVALVEARVQLDDQKS